MVSAVTKIYKLVVVFATTRVRFAVMDRSSPTRSAKLSTAASPRTTHGAASSSAAALSVSAPLEKSENARGKRKLEMQSSHVGDMLGDMPVALETLQLRSSSTRSQPGFLCR